MSNRSDLRETFRWGLRGQFFSLALMLMLLGVSAAAGAFWLLGTVRTHVDRLVEREGMQAETRNAFALTILQLRRYEKDYFLNLDRAVVRAEYLLAWSEAHADLQEALERLEPHLAAGEYASYKGQIAIYRHHFLAVVAEVGAGRIADAAAANSAMDENKKDIRTLLDSSSLHAKEATRYLAQENRYLLGYLVKVERQLGVYGGLLCLLGVAVYCGIYVLGAHTLHRVRCLGEWANSIASGEYETRVQDAGDDEIGVLARRFNDMASAVATRDRELDCARAEAEAGVRARDQFLAKMSHALRTPLNGVLGMNYLLLDSSLDAGQREYALGVEESAKTLLRVVEDLLEFTAIEVGQRKAEEDPFDLAQCVCQALEPLHTRAKKKSVDFRWQVDDDAAGVWVGDEYAVGKILTQLADNAIKFTEVGGVFVEAQRALGGNLCLRVQDSGPGVDPGQEREIFNAFSQADNFSTRRHNGTGLGLAIAAGLAAMMGGQVQLRSEEGVGSLFWVELPLEKIDEPLYATAS